jgi:hypothetical protein
VYDHYASVAGAGFQFMVAKVQISEQNTKFILFFSSYRAFFLFFVLPKCQFGRVGTVLA